MPPWSRRGSRAEQLRIQSGPGRRTGRVRPHVLAQTDHIGRPNGVLAATQGKLAAIGAPASGYSPDQSGRREVRRARDGRGRRVWSRPELTPLRPSSTRWLVPTVRTLEVLLWTVPAEATAMVWRRLVTTHRPSPETRRRQHTASWPARRFRRCARPEAGVDRHSRPRPRRGHARLPGRHRDLYDAGFGTRSPWSTTARAKNCAACWPERRV